MDDWKLREQLHETELEYYATNKLIREYDSTLPPSSDKEWRRLLIHSDNALNEINWLRRQLKMRELSRT